MLQPARPGAVWQPPGAEDAPVAHVMHDRGHGRDETRPIQVLPAPPGLFPHAAQAFPIERTVRDPHGGQLRSAVAALGITSRTIEHGGRPRPSPLRPAATGTSRPCTIRDVTLHEDAQRLRDGSPAQVMTAIRNTVIAVLWFYGAEFVPTNQEDAVSATGNF